MKTAYIIWMDDLRSSIKRRKCGDEIGGRIFDAIKLDWNCERSDRKFATVKLSHAVSRARKRVSRAPMLMPMPKPMPNYRLAKRPTELGIRLKKELKRSLTPRASTRT